MIETPPPLDFIRWEKEEHHEMSIIAPDTISPEQFFPEIGKFDPHREAHVLMFAVLKQAFHDLYVFYHTYAKASNAYCKRCKTLDWFKSADLSYIYSFLRICEELELDEKILLEYALAIPEPMPEKMGVV